MYKINRVTANLPADLLQEALHVTGLNITETLILGLKLIKRAWAYEKAEVLKGKVHLDIDLGLSRERSGQ